MGNINLTDVQIDALREIGSVGAGNAATALSKLLGKKIRISVPDTRVVRLEDVPEKLGGTEKIITAVYFQAVGNISASILFMFQSSDALRIVDLLTDKEIGHTKILDEFSQSALKELGNITTGSYVFAMSEFIKLSIFHSTPSLVTDMLGAVLDGILIRLGIEAEHALIIETEFTVGENIVKGWFLFIPDTDGLRVILDAIGMGS